jgi:hypothetical protein
MLAHGRVLLTTRNFPLRRRGRSGMREKERDKALLARLDPGARTELESLVRQFVLEELPTVDADMLYQAADRFEDRSAQLPVDEQLGGRLCAALLRQHARLFTPYRYY